MDTESNGGHMQEAASGLYCSVGRDVFRRDRGQGVWQLVLPDQFDAFGMEPLERPQPSPDGRHGAFVAASGQERHVCIFALPGQAVRILTSPLTGVYGMSWSPDGSKLCVIAGDPSVGVLSIDEHAPQANLSVFSLFVAGKDDADLSPIAGSIVLPGFPRWSPAGDAVAVVGLERQGSQVALVITMDGREGSLVTGQRVLLGATAWTASGNLLCAVTGRDGLVHVQLVNTATGAPTEVGEPWNDVCWLSVVDRHLLVAGKAGDAWIIADVTNGTRTPLTTTFPSIEEVVAGPGSLWVIAPVEGSDLGLWSMDLQGQQLRLHIAAPAVHGISMRQDGTAAVVMAGPVDAEIVRVYTFDQDKGTNIGRRDMIMGWIEERLPHGRPPRLRYLLKPMSSTADAPLPPEEPAVEETAPGPEEPASVTLPQKEEPVQAPQPEQQEEEEPVAAPAAAPTPREHDRTRWGLGIVIAALSIAAAVFIMLRQPGSTSPVIDIPSASPSTAVVVTPSATPSAVPSVTPSVVTPVTTPSATKPSPVVKPVATPSSTAATPSTPTTPSHASPAPVTPPVATSGFQSGSWIAPTERLRVRRGAGTNTAVLGYLEPAERARVLSDSPTMVGSTPWWNVRCYDMNGQAALTGWVSGAYVRAATAPTVTTVSTGTRKFIAPARGNLLVTSTPSGATVAIDGHAAGKTPVTVAVAYGMHTVTVSCPHYMEYDTTAEIRKPTSAGQVRTTHVTAPLIGLSTPSD